MSSFMLSKVDANRMLVELPVSTRILVTAKPARFYLDDHRVSVRVIF